MNGFDRWEEAARNRFQRWAAAYAVIFGFKVTRRGNWVDLERDGQTYECMTYEGVERVCREHGERQ